MTLDAYTLESIANVEKAHEECDGYTGCGCFGRLLAAVRGLPDPEGDGYRWPRGVMHGPWPEPKILDLRALNSHLADAYAAAQPEIVKPLSRSVFP